VIISCQLSNQLEYINMHTVSWRKKHPAGENCRTGQRTEKTEQIAF
jgi:hypothetical protein